MRTRRLLSGLIAALVVASASLALAEAAKCSRTNIRNVMRKKAPAFKACHEKDVQPGQSPQSKVVLRWTIQPDGSVSDAEIASSTRGSDVVHACLLKTLSKARFQARPGGGTCRVSFPLVFKAP